MITSWEGSDLETFEKSYRIHFNSRKDLKLVMQAFQTNFSDLCESNDISDEQVWINVYNVDLKIITYLIEQTLDIKLQKNNFNLIAQ